MAKSFSDRLLLRRISKTFNTKVFSKQNNVVAKAVNISPEWIHQSRLNSFDIFYENLGAFWPYWAEKQFSPFRSNSTPPNNELSCLNTSMLHRLQLDITASNSGFTIDESGFLTFPNKHWGLSIKQRIDHDVCPIFDTPFYLDTKA